MTRPTGDHAGEKGGAEVWGPAAAASARGPALAWDGRMRLAIVVFGAMVAFQSSPDVDATKVAYLIAFIVCLVGALAFVWRARHTSPVRSAGPLLAASAAIGGLLAVSLIVATANGTPLTTWIRDVAAYGMFAAVPLFALDAGSAASRRFLLAMLVVAGLVGSLSWAVEWLDRRDLLDLPFERLAFPSGQLPGALYLLAVAAALTSPSRRIGWAVLAGTTLAVFLLTGTRSSVLLVLGPLAVAVLLGRTRLGTSIRVLAVHVLVAVVITVGFQLALPVLDAALGAPSRSADPETGSQGDGLGGRFGSLPVLVEDPGSDASIQERVAQYRAAWGLFASSPVVGVGPGHPIDWIDVSGGRVSEFTADTPLVLAAKFGLLGVLVFIGVAIAYWTATRQALARLPESVATLALVGYGVWFIVTLPLGFVIEDKGASLALMLLLALVFAGRISPGPRTGLRSV